MDFDPVTGNLWDTENGPDYGDEINLVKLGFNSGWGKVQGICSPRYDPVRGGDFIAGEKLLNPNSHDLVDFDGKGKYSAPEFIWNKTVGPTAITFLQSDKYGKEYKNDLFVGDNNNGCLYHFDLNKDRTGLCLKAVLEDKVADSLQDLEGIIFGENGKISDIEVVPDEYLYLLSHHKNNVQIYKIVSINF